MKVAKGKAVVNKVSKEALKPIDDRKVGKRGGIVKADKSSITKAKNESLAKKVPNKPKRRLTAFFEFMEEFKRTFKKENPKVKSISVIGKAGGQKWKSMSAAEKSPYETRATKRKAEYEELLSAHNKEEQLSFRSPGLHQQDYTASSSLDYCTSSSLDCCSSSSLDYSTSSSLDYYTSSSLSGVCSSHFVTTSTLANPTSATIIGKENHLSSSSVAASTDLMSEAEIETLLSKLEKPVAQSSIDMLANEAAVHIQKGLVLSLQLTTEIDSMIIIANGAFVVLRSLSVNFASLYEKVRTFIKYSALLARVADSPNQNSSLEELEAQCHSKKLQLDKVSVLQKETTVSISKSNERIMALGGEISRTRDLLHKLEGEISSCKSERDSHTGHLMRISMDISKSKSDLQLALDTLYQFKKRRASPDTVQQAFERAKVALNEQANVL